MSIKKSLIFVYLTALLSSEIGCQSKSLSVSPTNSAIQATSQHVQRGVIYGLPKTLLKITVPYTIVRRTLVQNGVTQAPPLAPSVEVRKPIKIEPIYIADPSNLYVMTGAELFDSIWLDTSTKLTVGSNAMLSAVESDVTDKGPEVASSTVSSALTIAKLVAAAGPAEGEPMPTIKTRLRKIGDALKIAIEEYAMASDDAVLKKSKDKIDALLAERTMLLTIVKAYEDASTQTETLTEVEYTITIDPSDPTAFATIAGKPFLQHTLTPPIEIFGSDCRGVTPTVVAVNLYRSTLDQSISSQRAITTKIEGIPYRSAVPIRVTVDIGGAPAFDGYIPMSQYGSVAVADAKYKPWAHMKTAAKFDPITGSLVEYGVDASSSAEKAAKVLDESATKISTTLGEIQKARTDAATAAAAKPQADLTAQKNELQAQYDLDKLRVEYEKWKKDNGIK